VVEDYGHVGLTLRRHPVSFLREDIARRRVLSCVEAMGSRDRRWVEVAGLVLVRQRPGSAKGVKFITFEDETGVAKLVVWAKVFEAHRRIVLGAGIMGLSGRNQRKGDIIHLVAHSLADLSDEFATVGRRRGEGTVHDVETSPAPRMPSAKFMADPGRRNDGIRVRTRNSR
jgi:error-prone DNA polymerase